MASFWLKPTLVKNKKNKSRVSLSLSPYLSNVAAERNLSFSLTRAATYVRKKKGNQRQTRPSIGAIPLGNVSDSSRAWRTHRVWWTNATLAPFTRRKQTQTAKRLVKGDAFLYCRPVSSPSRPSRKMRTRIVAGATLTVLHLRKPRVWNVYFGDRSDARAQLFFNYLTRYTVVIPYAYTS